MSLEKITSKIIEDAEETKNSLLREARTKCEIAKKEAEAEAEKIVKEAEKKGLAARDNLVIRKKSVAEIDGKKIILEQKQKIIANCFDKAIDEIINIDKEKYADLLVKKILETNIKQGQLAFNEKESKTVAPLVLGKIKKLIPDNEFSLAEDNNIRGGFILKHGSIYINGTIEAMVDEEKDKLTNEIAMLLF